MPKYTVTALRHLNVAIDVEADDADMAYALASDYLEGVTDDARVFGTDTEDVLTEIIGVNPWPTQETIET